MKTFSGQYIDLDDLRDLQVRETEFLGYDYDPVDDVFVPVWELPDEDLDIFEIEEALEWDGEKDLDEEGEPLIGWDDPYV